MMLLYIAIWMLFGAFLHGFFDDNDNWVSTICWSIFWPLPAVSAIGGLVRFTVWPS